MNRQVSELEKKLTAYDRKLETFASSEQRQDTDQAAKANELDDTRSVASSFSTFTGSGGPASSMGTLGLQFGKQRAKRQAEDAKRAENEISVGEFNRICRETVKRVSENSLKEAQALQQRID